MPVPPAPPAIVAPALTLAAYRWRKRVVVVFASLAADPRLARQREMLDQLAKSGDARDLALVTVAGDSVYGVGETAAKLRRRFHITPGAFRALLIGKDGGVKLSEDAPIPADRLASVIDVMPMRRAEMRRR